MEWMTTCETLGISSPRPSTSVATSTLISPFRNCSSTLSRESCFLPLWMPSAWKPAFQRSVLSVSTWPFSFTNTSTLLSAFSSSAASVWALIMTIFFSSSTLQSSAGSKTITCCLMLSRAVGSSESPSFKLVISVPFESTESPGRPMRILTGASEHSSQAKDWTSRGHVAEKNAVCLSGRTCAAMVFMSPLNPMSSILSASSSTRKVTRAAEMLFSPRKSRSRPGVATQTCGPSYVADLSCSHFRPPP
mmetsp:Transcript_47959/g.77882  ORF Transcript_47959/g.77882 Transcript_47959/m.77882 type:complete len:248 (-) Transcript_47959:488-1231(-)